MWEQYQKLWRYLMVVPLLTSGYIMVITMVQLGLPNYGLSLGLQTHEVGVYMIYYACAGAGGALFGALLLQKIAQFGILRWKTLFLIICTLTVSVIYGLLDGIATTQGYLTILIVGGIVSGMLTPVSYSLVFDLTDRRTRGLWMGIITALIYFIAAITLPTEWTLAEFQKPNPVVHALTILTAIMLILIVVANPIPETVIKECQGTTAHRPYAFGPMLGALFLILYIDSFGFLRIVESSFGDLTWRGPLKIRAYIAVIHVVSALIFGWLYDKKGPIFSFISSLICFIIGQVLFATLFGTATEALVWLFPIFYATAVSIYTGPFLMMWAEISTPENHYKHLGIGTAVTGWFASFFSTGVSSALNEIISPNVHLIIAAILAILTLVWILRHKWPSQE